MTEQEINERRDAEVAKYVSVYAGMPDYRMGDARKMDARADLKWMREQFDATTLLDVGCGRGEILDEALAKGFLLVRGTEVVPELCDSHISGGPPCVVHCYAHQLVDMFRPNTFHCVTCYDVLEHLLPGDDEILLASIGLIASRAIALTANNMPSRDPRNGNELHINIRDYAEWETLIADSLGSDWNVLRVPESETNYVSATWHAVRY